jgi:hypothetical protein
MRDDVSRDPDHSVALKLWCDRGAVLAVHERVLVMMKALRVFSHAADHHSRNT